jgi:hypothetical protein
MITLRIGWMRHVGNERKEILVQNPQSRIILKWVFESLKELSGLNWSTRQSNLRLL